MREPVVVISGRGAANIAQLLSKYIDLTIIEACELHKQARPDGAIILTCLGGRTGTCEAIAVAKYLGLQNIPSMAIVTMPFSIEGADRCAYADQGLHELKQCVDYVRVFRNEETYLSTSISATFEKMDVKICREITAIVNRINEANL